MRITPFVLHDSNQTNGRPMREKRYIGRATSFDTFSAAVMPIRLGTNSPMMSVR